MPASHKSPDRVPVVVVLGPDRSAISGVSTHLNCLFASGLCERFDLRHFQVGSEGRQEGRGERLLRLVFSPFALAATLLFQRADVLHVNTSLNPRAFWRDLAYMAVARLLGRRVVCQVHGGDIPERFAIDQRIPARLLRACLHLPHVVVVLSQRDLSAYRNFVPGLAVRLLPNAIDHLAYARLVRPAVTRRRPLVLLYIGRLARAKGLYEAMHGLRLARLLGASARLVIAGDGPEEAGLRRVVAEQHLENDISFAGPAFGEEKMKLLADADVLLLPSYSEGLPYALLECMAAGMPAIVTPVGAIPDVVTDGRHGVFVAPRDVNAIARAIVRLATDPATVANMGDACRQRIAGFYSLARLRADFSDVYALPAAGDGAVLRH